MSDTALAGIALAIVMAFLLIGAILDAPPPNQLEPQCFEDETVVRVLETNELVCVAYDDLVHTYRP